MDSVAEKVNRQVATEEIVCVWALAPPPRSVQRLVVSCHIRCHIKSGMAGTLEIRPAIWCSCGNRVSLMLNAVPVKIIESKTSGPVKKRAN